MIFKNPRPILGFDDRLLVLVCIVLNTHTAMGIYYTSAFFKVPFNTYIVRWMGEFIVVTALWVVIRWLYLILIKHSPGLKNQGKRFLIIPLFLIPFNIISIIYIFYVQPFFDWNLAEFPEPLVAVRIITGTVILFVDVGLYEGLHLLLELKDIRIKEEQLRKEKLNAELMVLKNQMNPHFLFNSLTTLLHLIDTNTEKAKQYVHKLSQIYQSLLQNADQNLITLSQEIDNTKVFSELLNERFGDNFSVNFDIAQEHHEKLIVPFSLQIGVENAIKHNVISNKKPLTIKVFVDNDYILVVNDLQLKMQEPNTNGVGLKNISERYKLLSNQTVLFEKIDDSFVLKLPLLSSQFEENQ